MAGAVIVTEMLRAAERIAEAIVYKAAPEIIKANRVFPQANRNHLEQVQRTDERSALSFDKADRTVPADRVDPTDRPHSGADVRRPDHDRSRDRSGISRHEAWSLYEQVRDRQPDFAGTGNRVNRVETSAGPAVVRFRKEQPTVNFLKKWMPENEAIERVRQCDGVRTPEILYAGVDPATGGEFTIMRYVPGVARDFGDPELIDWLPDLLDQVRAMSALALPEGMASDITEWQQQMIQHADDAYHHLPPDRLALLGELGIGPLSDYVQPDRSRTGEPVIFAHNDLYPRNLQVDDEGRLWIFDWETAGPSDPLYNASFFLMRIGRAVDEATRAQATAMWMEHLSPMNPAVDVGAVLHTYRRMEEWRNLAMYAAPAPQRIAADPIRLAEHVDWYYERLSILFESSSRVSRDAVQAALIGRS